MGERGEVRKWRIRFSKGDEAKYISHLDTVKAFYRALRRAGINVAYTRGYNPRPKVSFGPPLSVGCTSDSEYLDLEVEGDFGEAEVVDSLNAVMPPGFKVLAAKEIKQRTHSLMSICRYALYEIVPEDEGAIDEGRIEDFLSKESVTLRRVRGDREKLVDLRKSTVYLESTGRSLRIILDTKLAGCATPREMAEYLLKSGGDRAEIARRGLFVNLVDLKTPLDLLDSTWGRSYV
ncbi:MAG: TIGR03936 family radical SAM-associated protein [bacterium]